MFIFSKRISATMVAATALLFSCGGSSTPSSPAVNEAEPKHKLILEIKSQSLANRINIQPLNENCSESCTKEADINTAMTLTAISQEAYRFVGWEGGCDTIDGDKCTFTLNQDKTVIGEFVPLNTFSATITVQGNGSVITSTGITCNEQCEATVQPGETITLTAQASAFSTFSGWSHASCDDQSTTCTLTLTEDTPVTAEFTATETVNVSLSIAGQGSIDVLNDGSTCTSACNVAIGRGETLKLQAKPANGYTLSAWSNNCLTSSSLCSVAVDSAGTYSVTFVPTSFNREENSMMITEPLGIDRTNHPIQFARPFAQGEIVHFPEVVMEGKTLTQQVNVKQRHDDGSVKHAIFNIIIDSLPAYSSTVVTFKNKTSSNNTALTKAQMLGTDFNFDAKMQFNFADLNTVSARDMINSGHYEYWLQGPVATSIMIKDHSAERIYDIGADSNRSVRPIFIVTFWPTLNEYTVRYVGENINTQTLQDQTYDLSLTLGNNDTQVYQKSDVPHQAMSRWTKQFHSAERFNDPLSIDHNVRYLVSTASLPNFDYNRIVPESQIAQDWTNWQSKQTDLYDKGWWQTAMSTAGGRPDIGLYPSWTVKWVFTGDWRHQEIAFKQAELAAAWPLHLREGDTGRFFDFDDNVPAVGHVISLAPNARPTHWTARPDWHEVNDNDKIAFLSPQTNSIWRPDTAHHPDLSSLQYLLSGDYFFLEQMIFSAAYVTGDNNAKATSFSYGRGPTGSEGALYSGVSRGQAWHFRTRLHTVDILPDDRPEKAYFDHIIKNGIALWEGKYHLANSYADRTDLYQFAYDTISKTAFSPTDKPSPLGQWETGIVRTSYVNDQFIDTNHVNRAAAPWMRNFVIATLGRGKELGYKTDNLLMFASKPIREPFAIDNFDASILTAYVIPTHDQNDEWFSDWPTLFSQYQTDYTAETAARLITGGDSEHGYYSIAMAAAAYSQHLPEGDKMWQYFNANVRSKTIYDANPKWAILPRQ